ncbi:MAG: NADP-dependent oxidoreductase [Sphingomonadales bacterium]|nr:NADP-dependent oxidoreductase [Sphingomonadales bacterium]
MNSENIVTRVGRMPLPGVLTADTYDYRAEPLEALKRGEIRIETIYASIDAGARGMLDPLANYPMLLRPGNRVYTSGVVGQVVESLDPAFSPGDFVRALSVTRQKYLTVDSKRTLGVRKVDPADGPLHIHIGALGMTGFTAWLGIFTIGLPKPGETVLVSAAAGAVGSVAGQIARAIGARVVGVAGGVEKCDAVVSRLGFDACVDYKGDGLSEALDAACPAGVDVYFENVGGILQKLVMGRMNMFGRMIMCGQVSQYDGSGGGRDGGPNLMNVVNRRLNLRGFISSDHMDLFPAFERSVLSLVRSGKLISCATVTKGFDQLHDAVNSLTQGRNFGQQVHQMADDPLNA